MLTEHKSEISPTAQAIIHQVLNLLRSFLLAPLLALNAFALTLLVINLQLFIVGDSLDLFSISIRVLDFFFNIPQQFEIHWGTTEIYAELLKVWAMISLIIYVLDIIIESILGRPITMGFKTKALVYWLLPTVAYGLMAILFIPRVGGSDKLLEKELIYLVFLIITLSYNSFYWLSDWLISAIMKIISSNGSLPRRI